MQTQNCGHAPHSSVSAPTVSESTDASRAVQDFTVQAMADPGSLPRVLEVFAKRGLVPCYVHAVRTEPAGGLVVDLHLANASAEEARLIAQELRRQFCVEAVFTAEQ